MVMSGTRNVTVGMVPSGRPPNTTRYSSGVWKTGVEAVVFDDTLTDSSEEQRAIRRLLDQGDLGISRSGAEVERTVLCRFV